MLNIGLQCCAGRGCAQSPVHIVHMVVTSPLLNLTLLTTYCALLLGAPAAPACLVMAWPAWRKADAMLAAFMKLLWQL